MRPARWYARLAAACATGNRYPDVFDAGFTFPERVCVLAPGPNGLACYDQIPKDFYVIGVSRAVLIDQVKIDCWVMQGKSRPFYLPGEQRFSGVRLFRRTFVSAGGAMLAGDSFERYSFDVERPSPGAIGDFSALGRRRRTLIGGSSISGNAVQLAHLCGARQILLCGVDMSGDSYVDGTAAIHPTHGETWSHKWAFDRLIEWIHGHTDTKVWTLSPTKLEVPRYAVSGV
jgi:hypothetical protein